MNLSSLFKPALVLATVASFSIAASAQGGCPGQYPGQARSGYSYNGQGYYPNQNGFPPQGYYNTGNQGYYQNGNRGYYPNNYGYTQQQYYPNQGYYRQPNVGVQVLGGLLQSGALNGVIQGLMNR